MTQKFKAIFFDFDGTLRIPSPGPTAAFIHFARTLNIPIPPAVERRVKIWAHRYWGQDQIVKQDMDRLGMDGFWVNYSKMLLETVDVSHDLSKRARLVREWFDTDYRPDVTLAAGSIELLSALKEDGYILGLISNRIHPFGDDLQNLGLADFFDISLAAGEIGYWKPNPRIFEYALSHFPSLAAEATMYIGDNYYADGRGAEAAGLTPVLFDPEGLYTRSTYHRIQHMLELKSLLAPLNGPGGNGRLAEQFSL